MEWKTNYHTHSTFSDGKNSLLEMVTAANELHLSTLGISDHSPVPVESDWNMAIENYPTYLNAIDEAALQFPSMKLLKGIEIDYLKHEKPLSQDFLSKLDYSIGSVHYLYTDDGFQMIDYDLPHFETLFNKIFDKNLKRFSKHYATQVCEMLELYHPTILGHIDLISKFNQKQFFFDEADPLYLSPLMEAMEYANQLGIIVEINTGAISRGYRNIPYPNQDLLSFANQKGIKLTLNSDTHNVETITTFFDETLVLLKELKIKSLYQIEKNRNSLSFKEVPIQ